jgi:hypothetical protein
MPTFDRTPGQLDLVFVIGDDLPIAIDLPFDLTSSTLEAVVYVSGTSVFAIPSEESESTPGETVVTPTVTVVDAAAGTLTVSMTEIQTATLDPNVSYRWYLRRTASGETRTILSGRCEARRP